MKRAVILIAALLQLGACSSLINGSTEEVHIVTPGAKDTRCRIENHYFRYTINPPRTFQIERTDEPYLVRCIAPGNRFKSITLPRGYEDAALLNVTNGIIPGTAYDLTSGALFHYPEEIVVDFTGIPTVANDVPDYNYMLQDNPLLGGYEEFRPGQPALQRDEHSANVPMQKVDTSATESYGSITMMDDKGPAVVSSPMSSGPYSSDPGATGQLSSGGGMVPPAAPDHGTAGR